MKKIIIGLVLLNSVSAFAVCVNLPLSKGEIRKGYIHRLCGSVQTTSDEAVFKVSDINETIGDALTWGVSRFYSKRTICKKLVSTSATYIPGTKVMDGDLETAFGLDGIKEIQCRI